METKLCRYCRRFVGKDGKHGICGLCWDLAQQSAEEHTLAVTHFIANHRQPPYAGGK